MSKTTFVFWGYKSEDVLEPLKNYMQNAGFNCIQLPDKEACPTPESEINLLRELDFVLITSAHFTRDKTILCDSYPEVFINLSPLEIIQECSPVASIFYPHDLVTPLVVNEPMLLSAFDLVLWPTPWFGYYPKPNYFLPVGWIKYIDEVYATNTNKKAWKGNYPSKCFFFSAFNHYMNTLGIEGVYQYLHTILKHDIAIKFPAWTGVDEFETYFKKKGVTVIPCEQNTFDFILNCELVITNHTSGIILEAVYAGKPTIDLVEDFSREQQHHLFSGLNGCLLSEYDQFDKAIQSPPPKPPVLLKPFDFKLALSAILDVVKMPQIA